MNEWKELTSIPRSAITSGGLCQVWGVPVEWVETFPSVNALTQIISSDIQLLAGKSWISFLWAHPSRAFSEEGKIFNGTPLWEQKLSGKLYSNTTDASLQHNNMLFHRWVFLVKEAGTGNIYVVGKPPVGAALSIQYNSNQGTITEVTAAFRSIHRAPIYTGNMPGAVIGIEGIFTEEFTLQFA